MKKFFVGVIVLLILVVAGYLINEYFIRSYDNTNYTGQEAHLKINDQLGKPAPATAANVNYINGDRPLLRQIFIGFEAPAGDVENWFESGVVDLVRDLGRFNEDEVTVSALQGEVRGIDKPEWWTPNQSEKSIWMQDDAGKWSALIDISDYEMWKVYIYWNS